MKLDALELPQNLYWQNEFGHKPVAQSSDRTVSGGVVVESIALSYGQRIILMGAWATRLEMLALKAIEATNAKMIFTDGLGQTYSVVFDIDAGGVQGELVLPEDQPKDDTLYELKIHLLTVSP